MARPEPRQWYFNFHRSWIDWCRIRLGAVFVFLVARGCLDDVADAHVGTGMWAVLWAQQWHTLTQVTISFQCSFSPSFHPTDCPMLLCLTGICCFFPLFTKHFSGYSIYIPPSCLDCCSSLCYFFYLSLSPLSLGRRLTYNQTRTH